MYPFSARYEAVHVVHQTDTTPGSGNALQACVCSLMRTSTLADVPNFIVNPRGYEEALTEFFLSIGCVFYKVPLDEAGHLPVPVRAGTLCVLRGPRYASIFVLK